MDSAYDQPKLWQVLKKYGFTPSVPGKHWGCPYRRGSIIATSYKKSVVKGQTRLLLPRRYKANTYLPLRIEDRVPEGLLEDVEATIKRIIVISELG